MAKSFCMSLWYLLEPAITTGKTKCVPTYWKNSAITWARKIFLEMQKKICRAKHDFYQSLECAVQAEPTILTTATQSSCALKIRKPKSVEILDLKKPATFGPLPQKSSASLSRKKWATTESCAAWATKALLLNLNSRGGARSAQRMGCHFRKFYCIMIMTFGGWIWTFTSYAGIRQFHLTKWKGIRSISKQTNFFIDED